MIDFILLVENYMYPFCCMIDHIIFLLLVDSCSFPVTFKHSFSKDKGHHAVKKKKAKHSVRRSASHPLSSFCNLVSIKKGQLYLPLCCVA